MLRDQHKAPHHGHRQPSTVTSSHASLRPFLRYSQNLCSALKRRWALSFKLGPRRQRGPVFTVGCVQKVLLVAYAPSPCARQEQKVVFDFKDPLF